MPTIPWVLCWFGSKCLAESFFQCSKIHSHHFLQLNSCQTASVEFLSVKFSKAVEALSLDFFWPDLRWNRSIATEVMLLGRTSYAQNEQLKWLDWRWGTHSAYQQFPHWPLRGFHLPERDLKVEVFPALAWPTKHSFTECRGCVPWRLWKWPWPEWQLGNPWERNYQIPAKRRWL